MLKNVIRFISNARTSVFLGPVQLSINITVTTVEKALIQQR